MSSHCLGGAFLTSKTDCLRICMCMCLFVCVCCVVVSSLFSFFIQQKCSTCFFLAKPSFFVVALNPEQRNNEKKIEVPTKNSIMHSHMRTMSFVWVKKNLKLIFERQKVPQKKLRLYGLVIWKYVESCGHHLRHFFLVV